MTAPSLQHALGGIYSLGSIWHVADVRTPKTNATGITHRYMVMDYPLSCLIASAASVARMKCSEIRDGRSAEFPDYALLHSGYVAALLGFSFGVISGFSNDADSGCRA